MQRLILYILAMLCVPLSLCGMDFGLRFNSHDSPPDKRTSILIGDTPYKIKKKFEMGFFYNFYATPMFGNIVTLTTNDRQRVALVASMIDDGSFRIALVVNDSLYYIKSPVSFDPEREDHLAVVLDKITNSVRVKLNNTELENPMNLKKTDEVSVVFGKNPANSYPDVAPIELRNARVFIDGTNTNHWDFKYHDTPTTSPDDIGGVAAVVSNPHWLIDDHTDWAEIYTLNTREKIQTAFNPETEQIYIVSNNRILSFNPVNGDTTVIPVKGGNRVMAFSNHIACHADANTLVNYNLNRKVLTTLNLTTKVWSNSTPTEDEEPNYSNHAVAVSGDTLFAYGGYGFYKYHNDLFTVNLRNGEIREHKLTPALKPLTSSAAAVVDGKLYIFGGKGNDTGRQELPSTCQYALYEYDIETWQGKKIWEIDSVRYEFLPTQSMYYDKENDCFYFAATCFGGQMLEISRTKPEIKALSTTIKSKMDFHDFVFDLYRSKDAKRFYLIIDKRLDPQNHDLRIYTISAPFISDTKLINDKVPNLTIPEVNKAGTFSWIHWCIALIILIAIGAGVWFILKRRKPAVDKATPMSHQTIHTESTEGTAEIENMAENEDFSFITFAGQDNDPQFFDRSKSSISFLGGFCVRDKEGNDITVKFTARLKHLLIMLLLSSLRYESGIKYQMIDEEIWGDKDEKSAQNNRNVSMRKLRMLLDEIGNVVISYDKGFFRIETNEVMFDYKEIKSRIDEIKGVESVRPELVNQILELLLMGPMLPNTHYDWLDKYKAEFSNSALEILIKLLKYELGRDDNLAYRIAETISLHDMLNEEALFAKCIVLSKRKMYGLAKNIYAKFSKEYLKNMGEEYAVSFAEACKKQI